MTVISSVPSHQREHEKIYSGRHLGGRRCWCAQSAGSRPRFSVPGVSRCIIVQLSVNARSLHHLSLTPCVTLTPCCRAELGMAPSAMHRRPADLPDPPDFPTALRRCRVTTIPPVHPPVGAWCHHRPLCRPSLTHNATCQPKDDWT